MTGVMTSATGIAVLSAAAAALGWLLCGRKSRGTRGRRATDFGQKDADFRFIIENSNQGYLIHRHHKAIYVNDEFVKLYGYDDAQEIYDLDSTQELIAPEWRDPTRHGKYLSKDIEAHEMDYQGQRKDGSIFWVNRRSFAIDWEGEPAVCSARKDISERIAGEQQLSTALDQANQANKAKTMFLSSMSHELRTPLNAIIGFSQLLTRGSTEALTARQHKAINHINLGGRHLLELVDQVLELSKIEQGKLDVSIESVSISDILAECLAIMRPIAEPRAITFTDNLNQNKHPSVLGDRTMLKQVLLNLLSNAVKYNCENGNVHIEAARISDQKLRLNISDQGSGISPEDGDKLFEPFERLDKKMSDIEGAGVGLTISKQLMDVMGGTIGLHSEDGNGATFWIELQIG